MNPRMPLDFIMDPWSLDTPKNIHTLVDHNGVIEFPT